WWIGLLIIVLIPSTFGVWYLTNPRPGKPPPSPDMEAVWHANNRGVCEMERFQFHKAVEAFVKVVEMAPDWRPGRLNLAIARMNKSKNVPEDLDRAIEAFEQLVRDNADDHVATHAHHCLGIIFTVLPSRLEEAGAHFLAVARADEDDASAFYWLGWCRMKA